MKDTFGKDNISSYDNNEDQENVKDNVNGNDNLPSEVVTEYSLESEASHFDASHEVDNIFSEDNNEKDIEIDNEQIEGEYDEITDEKQNNGQESDNEKGNSEGINKNDNNDNEQETVKNKSKSKNKTIKNEEGDNIYTCEWDDCYNRYENFDDFIEHLNKEHIENTTKDSEFACLWKGCQRINKPNGNKAALRNHVRIHTDEKPFECEYCHKKFKRSDALSKHKKKCNTDSKFTKRKRDEDNDTPHSSKKRASSTNNKYSLISDHNSSSISSSKTGSKNKISLDKKSIIKEEYKHSSHNKSHRSNKSKNIINIHISNSSSSSSKSYKELYRELKAKYRHSLQENMILEEEYQCNYRQVSRLKLERNIILDNLIKHHSL